MKGRLARVGLALLLVAGCVAPQPFPQPLPPAPIAVPPQPAPVPQAAAGVAPSPAQCRVGPGGGVPLADRGIGGTGAAAGVAFADRGIGGTGAPSTGIVGIITGFASVCLAGEEVQYGPGTPVTVDGRPGAEADLRAGQVAAVGAAGMQPFAQTIAVRHEVSGPVDGMDPDGLLVVAGQRVLPPPEGVATVPGQWLQVSGFRRPDGVIVASRLDPRGPGEVLVRGIMQAYRGRLFIGRLEVRPGPGQFVQPGVPVVAIGQAQGGVLYASAVQADGLLLDPAAYFGGVPVLVVQGYAEGGFVFFGGRRYPAAVRPGFATLRLRQGPGGFAPVSAAPFGPERPGFGAGPRAGFAPAPVPNRGFGGGPFGGGFGPGGGGERGGFRGGPFGGGPFGGGRGGGARPGPN